MEKYYVVPAEIFESNFPEKFETMLSDGTVSILNSNEVKSTTATLIKTVDVIDLDGDAPIVQVSIYKEQAGGIFGVDSSYIETEEPVYSPFGNGEVDIEE
jgi:hypothetical protein